jgi:hypothetical protein
MVDVNAVQSCVTPIKAAIQAMTQVIDAFGPIRQQLADSMMELDTLMLPSANEPLDGAGDGADGGDTCANCDSPVPAGANNCPNCGAPVKADATAKPTDQNPADAAAPPKAGDAPPPKGASIPAPSKKPAPPADGAANAEGDTSGKPFGGAKAPPFGGKDAAAPADPSAPPKKKGFPKTAKKSAPVEDAPAFRIHLVPRDEPVVPVVEEPTIRIDFAAIRSTSGK